MPTRSFRCGLPLALACLMATAVGQVDSVRMVLDPAAGIGTKALAAFGYDPENDSIFVTTYGASPTAPGNGTMVRFDGIASGTPTFTTLMSEAQLQLYYRDGDPNRSVSTPTQGGILLNPLPVGGRPAYSFALIADASTTRLPSSNTIDPAATKRIYSYSLQPLTPGQDGRDVFTTRVTLADMKAIAGTASTSNSIGRQFAWSGDGQSIYVVDSSTAYDGLWQVDAVSGSVQRLLADDMDTTEPAVFRSGGVDTILFGGGGSTSNDGGIDKVTYDGSTVSGRQVAVPAAALREFHETTANANIAAVATDSDGNLYYSNTTNANISAGTPTQRGIFRIDTDGRISKVVSYTERKSVFGDRGSVNSSSFRIQPRTVTYSGAEGEFDLVQLLYAEPSGVNAIGGAFAFKAGDFNRDNVVNADDVGLFASQVTLRGVVKTAAADLKYDFNANDVVDWKDVQIFQQFLEYGSPTTADPSLRIFADADFNGVVDFADFRIMRDNLGQAGKTFLAGDFDGNNRVDFADLQFLDRGYGAVSGVFGTGVTPVPFEQAEWDALVSTVQIGLNVASGVVSQSATDYPRITVAAGVTKSGAGQLVFNAANTYTGPTTVSAGTLQLLNAEAVVNSAVTVAAGATLSVGPAVQADVAGLAIDPAGLVDLTSGRLIVAGGVDAAALRAAILVGRNGGAWNGVTGISSSTAAASGGTRAVGYSVAADGSARVAYAASGDADLNGEVNVFDLIGLNGSATYGNGQPAVWSQGDFNYDGVTNVFDLVSIQVSGAYGQGSYLSLANPAPLGSPTAVPEPGGLALFLSTAAAAIAAVRRRRWRRTVS
jgi:autotransporter-associated beta strand protein